MIQDIFSVPIYKIKLDLDISRLQTFCNLHQNTDEGRVVSNTGGYQSNNLFLDDISLQPLVKEIFAKAFIGQDNQTIVDLWFNISLYKDTNAIHRHVGCDISGVYYVKTPNECGNIKFIHPAQDILDWYYKEKPKELNSYNSDMWWMPAEVNNLYLFPSWLKHLVEPNRNEVEERMSIAFNTSKKIIN